MAFQTLPQGDQKGDRPWWLIAFLVLAVALGAVIFVSDLYAQVFNTVVKGLGVTVFVTLMGFLLATALGLLIALLGMSDHIALRQAARFYVEVVRGIPILVLLFYIAFVGAPAFVTLYNLVTAPLISAGLTDPMVVRDFSLMWRAITGARSRLPRPWG
jgi:polar amino acid transport system permease protein